MCLMPHSTQLNNVVLENLMKIVNLRMSNDILKFFEHSDISKLKLENQIKKGLFEEFVDDELHIESIKNKACTQKNYEQKVFD